RPTGTPTAPETPTTARRSATTTAARDVGPPTQLSEPRTRARRRGGLGPPLRRAGATTRPAYGAVIRRSQQSLHPRWPSTNPTVCRPRTTGTGSVRVLAPRQSGQRKGGKSAGSVKTRHPPAPDASLT